MTVRCRLAVLAILTVVPACHRPTRSQVATLVQSQGNVEAGRGGSYGPAHEGMPLSVGDVVRTNQDSTAKLGFTTGTALRLGQRGLVRLVTGLHQDDAAPDVEFGEAHIEGTGTFQVASTRGLIRLDPGTRIRVRASTQGTRYDLLAGTATLMEISGETRWHTGEGIDIGFGGANVSRYELPGTADAGADAGPALPRN